MTGSLKTQIIHTSVLHTHTHTHTHTDTDIYIRQYIFLKMRFKLYSYDHHVNSFGKLYAPFYYVNLLIFYVVQCSLVFCIFIL